ncbi:Uncharacterised protein [Mycobacteroides abscessus subsp. abscessus]|nr:Uncharacterised protein [Mycobacteroides abscessus subsp. abscessus]
MGHSHQQEGRDAFGHGQTQPTQPVGLPVSRLDEPLRIQHRGRHRLRGIAGSQCFQLQCAQRPMRTPPRKHTEHFGIADGIARA